MSMEGSFQYIPEDIIINDILPALPTKSLSRFKCVSRQWSCWTSETKPTVKHKVMTRFYTTEGNLLLQSVDEATQVKDVDLPWEGIDPRKIKLFGSCDGLLLISINGDVFLWNPTIQFRTKIFSSELSDHLFSLSGLCFDSYHNVYKVVLYFHRFWKGRTYVTVGSYGSNSWEEINFPYIHPSQGPVFNDYLHWYVDSEEECVKHNKIIYFDPKKNEFANFPMPEPRGADGDRIDGLGVLDGCLCMARREKYRWGSIEVLVMKQYRVKESWEVLFKIADRNIVGMVGCLNPLFYTETKDGVLMTFGKGMVTLNLHSGERIVTVQGYGATTYVYDETLIRPSRYSSLIEDGALQKEEDNSAGEEPVRKKGKKEVEIKA